MCANVFGMKTSLENLHTWAKHSKHGVGTNEAIRRVLIAAQPLQDVLHVYP